MNLKALHKLEKSYIQLDWFDYIHKFPLTEPHMTTVVDMIDTFKNNKSAKELVVFRFKDIPAYVTIKREQYTHLLDFIHSQAVGLEMYELCAKVLTIKKEL
jgi:hypothetical protein